jgi:hypothetical protein
MVGNSTRVVRATLALILAAGWLRAAPPAMAQGALDGARSVLTRIMDAVIARDADAARALATEELRAQSPGAFVGVSNPCTYRYEVLAFTPTAPGIVAARVRIYQHFWPGDVGGGPPSSFQQDVGLIQTAAGWRVSRLGPQQNARQEPNESHGPTTSACNVGRRPGVWLATPRGLPATGAGPGAALPVALLAPALGALLLGGRLLVARTDLRHTAAAVRGTSGRGLPAARDLPPSTTDRG